MSAARWTRVVVRLWASLCEAGTTVALQHGIPMMGTQTLINSPVSRSFSSSFNSPVHGAGETA